MGGTGERITGCGKGGWEVNRKRVQRLWREEGLRVPQRRRKCRRLGESTVPAERLRAERPNHVWAFDFQFDQTADGRALKLLNVVDEFTRELLAMFVEPSIDADRAVSVPEALAAERGGPELLRCDNGPEMTGHALRDWCEQSKAETAFIEPGAPWQHPFVASFHARVRDQLLDVEEFCFLAEARVVNLRLAGGRQLAPAALIAPGEGTRRVRRRMATNEKLPAGA